jgi:hypothetical protein
MILLRFVIDAIVGSVGGAVIGFGMALIAMSVNKTPQSGGAFGMMEVIILVPSGALIGLLAGIFWWCRAA